jgi:transcriptional regulator with XRE-family HTH domain
VSRFVVDPAFPATLRGIREQRGLSLRELANRAYSSGSQLQRLEAGGAQPTPELTRDLDDALDAGGRLAALVTAVEVEIDDDRLAYAARYPRRTDAAVIDDLAVLLAAQRRLDDAVGSATVLSPADAQVATIEALVGDARDEVLRKRILDVGSQWAQFAGWLHAATGNRGKARGAFAQALEWATEADDRDMIATLLSFKAYLAEGAGQIGSMIGLSEAAQRDPGVYAGQRAYSAGQEARARAIAGEEQPAIAQISEAAELAAEAGEAPPWVYFHTPDFFVIQRGIVYKHLGDGSELRNRQAIDMLTGGLDGLAPDARRAEWAGVYICHLVEAQARAGDLGAATATLREAQAIAATSRSVKLSARVGSLARKWGLSLECP